MVCVWVPESRSQMMSKMHELLCFWATFRDSPQTCLSLSNLFLSCFFYRRFHPCHNWFAARLALRNMTGSTTELLRLRRCACLRRESAQPSVAIVCACKRRPLWSRCTKLTRFQLQLQSAAKILRIVAFRMYVNTEANDCDCNLQLLPSNVVAIWHLNWEVARDLRLRSLRRLEAGHRKLFTVFSGGWYPRIGHPVPVTPRGWRSCVMCWYVWVMFVLACYSLVREAS